jgi:hypothetical protein
MAPLVPRADLLPEAANLLLFTPSTYCVRRCRSRAQDLIGRHVMDSAVHGRMNSIPLPEMATRRYCLNSDKPVSTRARIGVCPNCESIRFASVRWSSASECFFLIL